MLNLKKRNEQGNLTYFFLTYRYRTITEKSRIGTLD